MFAYDVKTHGALFFFFRVEFECDNGNELQGPDSITCLPTGKESCPVILSMISKLKVQ